MKKTHTTIATLTLLIIIITITTITIQTQTQTNNPQTTTPPTQTTTPPQTNNPTQTTTPVRDYSIIQTYPHDPSAFTQGLTFDDKGNLIESTGLNGKSSLRRVNLTNGQILQQIDLPYEYFGEGTTIVDNKIIQLTWQNKIGLVYNKETFELIDNFDLNTEGWGITYNGTHLIMSDGTSTLHILDPNTYQTINHINVHDTNGPVEKLNELEYINGTIYANIWLTTKIATINPTTGQIETYIDLEEIAKTHTTKDPNAVLNGIAYNTQTNKLYITGKLWPNIYEIQIT
jgi:glutamine cyclotransferase